MHHLHLIRSLLLRAPLQFRESWTTLVSTAYMRQAHLPVSSLRAHAIPTLIVSHLEDRNWTQAKNSADYFTWTRDSAIAIKALVDHLILTGDASLQDIINAWIVSQAEIQTVSTAIGTLNDGSGLGEAKFQVDGSAINGNAGNPENDAPALRAIALEEYARYLIDNGDIETASGLLWSVLANDLAYVKQYWNSTSFDVW